MADDVQGLIVYTEDDRFVTINRAGRARVWRVDLSGEPVDDVDRTGVAHELPVVHEVVTREGSQQVRVFCRCGFSDSNPVFARAVEIAVAHLRQNGQPTATAGDVG